jgi:hypothetical protein
MKVFTSWSGDVSRSLAGKNATAARATFGPDSAVEIN